MKIRLLMLSLFLFVIQNCANDSLASYQKRRGTSLDDTASTDETTRSVGLILNQSVINCSDNPKCHLEEIQNISQNEHSIKSLIVADSDLLSSTNINISPTLSFSISGIDDSSITSVSYSYTKKDALGKIIIQTEDNLIHAQDGFYYIPINSKTLGTGILSSVPHEQHLLSLKIKSSDNNIYSDYISFSLLSQMTNPISFDRATDILSSSYYKMDEDENSYIIDSIELKNTLGYTTTVSGTINIYNQTISFLSNVEKQQKKVFVSKEYYAPYYYNYDRYNWYTNPIQTHKTAIATPSYILKIRRGTNTVEEIPINIQSNNEASLLSFNKVELQGFENVRLDITVQFNINNSLLGEHGQKNFYEGFSMCEYINEPEKCYCFFLPVKQSFNSEFAANIYYSFPNAIMLGLKDIIYPACGAFAQSTYISQQLFPVTYPETILSLVGRHHLTNTSYTITSWLKGYEEIEDLGTTSKTMDPLESQKGFVDYTVINLGESYQGYIPGVIN